MDGHGDGERENILALPVLCRYIFWMQNTDTNEPPFSLCSRKRRMYCANHIDSIRFDIYAGLCSLVHAHTHIRIQWQLKRVHAQLIFPTIKWVQFNTRMQMLYSRTDIGTQKRPTSPLDMPVWLYLCRTFLQFNYTIRTNWKRKNRFRFRADISRYSPDLTARCHYKCQPVNLNIWHFEFCVLTFNSCIWQNAKRCVFLYMLFQLCCVQFLLLKLRIIFGEECTSIVIRD